MIVHDHNATCAMLSWLPLADEVRAVLRDKRAGLLAAPARIHLPLPNDGVPLAMPAADSRIAITKLVTVHPHNAEHNLPSIHGEMVVMDAQTGQRLMLLDGRAVTARRTAAVSLVAAQSLASEEAKRGPLLIIGAGVQARAHAEALYAWQPALDVLICSRNFDKAKSLAHDLHHVCNVNAQAIGNIADVLPVCGLIVTATTSATPVLQSRVRDDALIIAVGAYSRKMAEVPAGIVQRCEIFVDTLEGAQHEAGDLIQANVDWSRVTALEDIVQGSERFADPRSEAEGIKRSDPSSPVLFKSVGHALWDLAAARLAVKHGNR
jgi:ornithine cyclodeaminase